MYRCTHVYTSTLIRIYMCTQAYVYVGGCVHGCECLSRSPSRRVVVQVSELDRMLHTIRQILPILAKLWSNLAHTDQHWPTCLPNLANTWQASTNFRQYWPSLVDVNRIWANLGTILADPGAFTYQLRAISAGIGPVWVRVVHGDTRFGAATTAIRGAKFDLACGDSDGSLLPRISSSFERPRTVRPRSFAVGRTHQSAVERQRPDVGRLGGNSDRSSTPWASQLALADLSR